MTRAESRMRESRLGISAWTRRARLMREGLDTMSGEMSRRWLSSEGSLATAPWPKTMRGEPEEHCLVMGPWQEAEGEADGEVLKDTEAEAGVEELHLELLRAGEAVVGAVVVTSVEAVAVLPRLSLLCGVLGADSGLFMTLSGPKAWWFEGWTVWTGRRCAGLDLRDREEARGSRDGDWGSKAALCWVPPPPPSVQSQFNRRLPWTHLCFFPGIGCECWEGDNALSHKRRALFDRKARYLAVPNICGIISPHKGVQWPLLGDH